MRSPLVGPGAALLLLIASCASPKVTSAGAGRSADASASDGGAGGGGGVDAGAMGGGFVLLDAAWASCHPCSDFPKEPVTDPAGGPIPTGVAYKFGPPVAATGGEICIVEPQDGVLLPQNGLRPRDHLAGHRAQRVTRR